MEFLSRNGQIGIEYLIVVSFITFAIVSTIVFSIYYSSSLREQLILSQVENFANQLLNSAESVYYAGEPSKTTISIYLPQNVKSVEFNDDNILFRVEVSDGRENVRAYYSSVRLQGSIPVGEGLKKINLEAKEDYVSVVVSD